MPIEVAQPQVTVNLELADLHVTVELFNQQDAIITVKGTDKRDRRVSCSYNTNAKHARAAIAVALEITDMLSADDYDSLMEQANQAMPRMGHGDTDSALRWIP